MESFKEIYWELFFLRNHLKSTGNNLGETEVFNAARRGSAQVLPK